MVVVQLIFQISVRKPRTFSFKDCQPFPPLRDHLWHDLFQELPPIDASRLMPARLMPTSLMPVPIDARDARLMPVPIDARPS